MRNRREKFCKLAMTDRQKAAQLLRDKATGLENCKNTSDIIFALTDIFDVSERTIFRDLVK